MCVIDPQTFEATLVGETRHIALTNLKNCIVECKDGLYDGYEIKDNIELIKSEISENPLIIYNYNYVYFTIIKDNVLILDVRKPKGGLNTKMARAF
jgi:hypothetical protein